MRLIERLKSNKMTLIVSLPQNTLELALAAVNGGADAIKVHTNVFHRASGNRFPRLIEQVDILEEIVRKVNIPVGIVPGGDESCIEKEEIKILKDIGFDFISMFVHHMPLYIYKSGLTIMSAITRDYTIDEIKTLNYLNVDIIEADMLPEDKSDTIHLADLMRYREIVECVNKPVVVPTQRIILPEEVEDLYNIGAKGFMIGAVVTGNNPEQVEKATSEYRKAINRL
ncbi:MULTISPECIES: hypothetical protein [Thermoanaerobacter]|uniref:Uncharacterized protein n=2 Tax=Thermoanaerobacter TaxID=1754 RepID=B0KC96_THEP3|nr:MULTISPECIES: hypothetical protein [Thermoanaerobacter]ABY95450.1 hypothetical protein Teth39_1814 [Thermoanaerobacter pseudethanolicus ATCC 33223]ADV80394.1 hypothetical protein Thebr_1861 [Thermoanaerobacter brockii subsp. finnii Ako-1]HBW59328.1 hypothetical protein [Thermoanaerobacter sp.]